MKDDYIAYKCLECGLVFVITEGDANKGETLGKYLSCPYGHRHIEKLNAYEGLRECMSQKHSVLI